MLLKKFKTTVVDDTINPDELIIKVSDYMLPYASKKICEIDKEIYSESLEELGIISVEVELW